MRMPVAQFVVLVHVDALAIALARLASVSGGGAKVPECRKGTAVRLDRGTRMTTTQNNWRWCRKCQALHYAAHPLGSVCPAGGGHDAAGSGHYSLFTVASPPANAQGNWRWCAKCQGVFYGEAAASVCPAGGQHDRWWSLEYAMPTAAPTPQSQSDWRWCRKCQGLFYGGSPTSVCPAGGAHSKEGSGNYVLSVADGPGSVQNALFRIVSAYGPTWVLGESDGRTMYTAGHVALRANHDHKWLLKWVSYPTTFKLARAASAHIELYWPFSSAVDYAPLILNAKSPGYEAFPDNPDSLHFEVDPLGDGWVAINNRSHSKVLDVWRAEARDGCPVIAWPWNEGTNQRWRMVPVA